MTEPRRKQTATKEISTTKSSASGASQVVPTKQELKKHVAAIHTSGELGLLERKLVNVLLLNAFDVLTTVRRHKIPTKMLMAMLGWTEGEDTVHLKKALRRIVSTPVEFNLMDGETDPKKDKGWRVSALLAEADLVDGHCEYEYSSGLASKLANPEVYAVINVGIQRQFKSGYALTLYENCVRYRRTGSTGTMSLDKFRRLMGAMSPTYDDFRRLSDLVIKKAVDEVRVVSDIAVTPEYSRTGRKVTGIKFKVEEKQQQSIFTVTENENLVDEAKKSETFKRLLRHGIGEKLAVAWVLTDESRAKAALDLTEQRARNNQIHSTTGGYIKRLIEDPTIDLSPSAFEKEMEEARQQEKAAEVAAVAAKQQADQASQERSEKIKVLVKALSANELKSLSDSYSSGPGADASSSYNPNTGKFQNAAERIRFMAWVRTKIAEQHGI